MLPFENEAEIGALPLLDDGKRPEVFGFVDNDLRAVGLAMATSAACENPLKTTNLHARNANNTSFAPKHLQGCYCQLATKFGFEESILQRFKLLKTVQSPDSSYYSVLIHDTNDASLHIFSFGLLPDILKLCSLTHIAPKSQIRPLNDSLSRKLLDFDATMQSRDVSCVAFAYRPVLKEEADRLLAKHRKMPQHDYIFLGVLATQPEPKEHLQEFIDDLDAAGILFVWFSPLREQGSKAFAERLGLETDWNSCILLSEAGHSHHARPAESHISGYSALSDIKAKLPRGVAAIRPHLEHVDDIPLHVSLFAECETEATAEMIRIYQENGEVVGVVGSCRSMRARECFRAGNVAIGYDLFDAKASGPFDVLSAEICEQACFQLTLPSSSSPYILIELIRESRTWLRNWSMAWEYLSGVFCCLTFSQCRSNSCLMQAILLAASIASVQYDPSILRTHPGPKESLKTRMISKFTIYSARFFPFLMSIWLGNYINVPKLYYSLPLWSQSLSFLHPVRPFTRRQLLHKSVLIWQVLFGCLFLHDLVFSRPALMHTLLSIFIAISLFYWHELVKSSYLLDLHEDTQKRAKLLFSTKLGMHSPV